MKTQVKHTATPYRVEYHIGKPVIMSKKLIIAELVRQETSEETQRNAQFIVKAVNNHDKLVEALRHLVGMFEQDHRDCDKWIQYREAKEALAESKGAE